MSARRAGHSLVELVVAAAVGAVVLAGVAALLAAEARLARGAAEHAARQDALRVTWNVLSAELRYLAADRDMRAGNADSVGVRALRGVLLPCEAAGVFRYRGLRAPDAAKDSVVAARTGGVAAFQAGAAPAADACGAPNGDPLVGLVATPPGAETGEPLHVFESGAYHLQGRALRYRIGGEGRQPLTGEWFDDAGSAFATPPPVAGGSAVVLRLEPRRLGTTHDAPGGVVVLRFWARNGGAP